MPASLKSDASSNYKTTKFFIKNIGFIKINAENS